MTNEQGYYMTLDICRFYSLHSVLPHPVYCRSICYSPVEKLNTILLGISITLLCSKRSCETFVKDSYVLGKLMNIEILDPNEICNVPVLIAMQFFAPCI